MINIDILLHNFVLIFYVSLWCRLTFRVRLFH